MLAEVVVVEFGDCRGIFCFCVNILSVATFNSFGRVSMVCLQLEDIKELLAVQGLAEVVDLTVVEVGDGWEFFCFCWNSFEGPIFELLRLVSVTFPLQEVLEVAVEVVEVAVEVVEVAVEVVVDVESVVEAVVDVEL